MAQHLMPGGAERLLDKRAEQAACAAGLQKGETSVGSRESTGKQEKTEENRKEILGARRGRREQGRGSETGEM